MDWIDLAQDRDHGNEPPGSKRFLSSRATGGFSIALGFCGIYCESEGHGLNAQEDFVILHSLRSNPEPAPLP
jgi:hypothetical protein